MTTDIVIVLTTVGASADVDALATTLVDERLAACVNALPAMDSIYRWQGRIERERERQLVIKTTAVRLAALRERLSELHPYDVPELLVIPVADGGQAYLDWVRVETTPDGAAGTA
jgi:periplasmic divalent cation tolerance protein